MYVFNDTDYLLFEIPLRRHAESCGELMPSSSERFRYLIAVYLLAAELGDDLLRPDRSSYDISYLP